MSATASGHEPAPGELVMVARVQNPEGRCSLHEVRAVACGGVVARAGSQADRRSRQRPPRGARPPFVLYAPRVGGRELSTAVRALRNGWSPMLSTGDVHIPAEHPEAWCVRVMELDEPVYRHEMVARARTSPALRAEVEEWLREGARRAMPAEPESVLRATSAGVQ